jgi:hypothetical protein
LLDQLPPLASAANRARHLYTAFFLVNIKARLASLFRGFLSPADGEMSIRLLERAVLNCTGCQLMQSHRKRLDCAGEQPNACRSVKRDPSTISPNSLRDELGLGEYQPRETDFNVERIWGRQYEERHRPDAEQKGKQARTRPTDKRCSYDRWKESDVKAKA